MEEPDHVDWRNVASLIKAHLSCREWSRRDVPALFLIAAILRKVPVGLLEELQRMLQVNVKDSPIVKEVFDEGAMFGAAEAYRSVINATLEAMHLSDESITPILHTLGVDQLADLAKGINRFADPISEIRAMRGYGLHLG